MIGHSILHGGPGLHALSPAAKHYLSTGRGVCDDQLPPPIELADIADRFAKCDIRGWLICRAVANDNTLCCILLGIILLGIFIYLELLKRGGEEQSSN